LAWIEEIHARALENIKPDLTFLLDLPVEVGLRRAWKRLENDKTQEDRFEKEALDFHQRIREGYLTLARNEPGRIIVLDGMKDEEDLHREIVSHLPPFPTRMNRAI
jgi:dTMP kinase